MKSNKTKNIVKAIAVGIGYVIFMILNGSLFKKLMPDTSDVLLGIITRVIDTIVLLILVCVMHKKDIFKNKSKGFFGTFTTAGVEFIPIGLSVLNFFLNVMGEKIISPIDIALMCTEMLFVGITEELISRGLVLGFFHDAFGSSTKKGAYMTAICSGMVFGCFHLLNLINTTNRTAIYAQVIANVCTGFLWGAVYLRKRNIFALMLLHTVSDIAAMVSSGYLTGKKDVSAAIDSTSPLVMIVAAIYVVAGIYVLRDEKMHYISEKTATVHPSTV